MTRRQILAQTRADARDLFTRGLTGGHLDALFVRVARANPAIESEAIHRAIDAGKRAAMA